MALVKGLKANFCLMTLWLGIVTGFSLTDQSRTLPDLYLSAVGGSEGASWCRMVNTVMTQLCSCYSSYFPNKLGPASSHDSGKEQDVKSQCTRIFLTSGCVMFDNISLANASAVVDPGVRVGKNALTLIRSIKSGATNAIKQIPNHIGVH